MKRKFNLPVIAMIVALTASTVSCLVSSATVITPSPSQKSPQANESITIPAAEGTEPPQNPPAGQADQQSTEIAANPTMEATAVPSGNESSPPIFSPCAEEVCIQDNPDLLLRPVGSEGRVTVDPSFRFGEFRRNSRYPNPGVEFLNSTGTPVVAAAAGKVLVAGTDSQIAYARNLNQYGNLVILEHSLESFDQPVFTLYGHLSEVLVQEGDTVEAGQEIGKVGATGNIRGSVLHFEVRVGDNSYEGVRNPELWLVTRQDENGQSLGALAGRIINSQGKYHDIRNIVVERLDASGQAVVGRTYLRTYGSESLRGNSPWEESFGIGDLIPGTYKLSFLLDGYQTKLVEVQAGKLTLITIVQ